jgi:UDP-N-acetylmuramyl pentapeptide phosphotransferase/UDP-N-acetylglucosamine-1-phosphate transferase
MTTALMIFGGLAAIGWISDKLQTSPAWRDMQHRMKAPLTAPRSVAKPVSHAAKPRIINPLEETYSGEWTTLSAQ